MLSTGSVKQIDRVYKKLFICFLHKLLTNSKSSSDLLDGFD